MGGGAVMAMSWEPVEDKDLRLYTPSIGSMGAACVSTARVLQVLP